MRVELIPELTFLFVTGPTASAIPQSLTPTLKYSATAEAPLRVMQQELRFALH